MQIEYSFFLVVKDKAQFVFEKYFANINGSFVFGRSYDKCKKKSKSLAPPVTIVKIPYFSPFLSNFHAVICKVEGDYTLVDGWGEYRSKNGVYVNKQQTEFSVLNNKDTIHLGSMDTEIIFYKTIVDNDNDKEKDTENSEFF